MVARLSGEYRFRVASWALYFTQEALFVKPLGNLLSKWEKSLLSRLSKLIFIYSTVLLIILPLSPKSAYTAQATLVWNPVIHPDIAGYMIYYGTSSGDYDVSLDVGNWTSVTIAGLDGSKTYYFAATAYSTYGEESDFSNEVSWSSTHIDYDAGFGGGCFIATTAYGSRMAKKNKGAETTP